MGRTLLRKMPQLPSDPLTAALQRIYREDPKRALEVASFYSDLFASISHIAKVIKPGGHACFVVGNRKVKGVILPTDIAVRNFFEECGFEHVETFTRAIPNKRMPLRNSPTNAPGVSDNTMTKEFIVVMRSRLVSEVRHRASRYRKSPSKLKRPSKNGHKTKSYRSR